MCDDFCFPLQIEPGVDVCGVNRDVDELVAHGVDVHSVSEKMVVVERRIVCELFFRRQESYPSRGSSNEATYVADRPRGTKADRAAQASTPHNGNRNNAERF